MKTPYDNGPAFPQHVAFSPNGEAVTAGMYFAEGPGMSLREYFAAMAMQGLLANHELISMTKKGVAKESVEQAEALMEALRA